jgi:hypothetical protein
LTAFVTKLPKFKATAEGAKQQEAGQSKNQNIA